MMANFFLSQCFNFCLTVSVLTMRKFGHLFGIPVKLDLFRILPLFHVRRFRFLLSVSLNRLSCVDSNLDWVKLLSLVSEKRVVFEANYLLYVLKNLRCNVVYSFIFFVIHIVNELCDVQLTL